MKIAKRMKSVAVGGLSVALAALALAVILSVFGCAGGLPVNNTIISVTPELAKPIAGLVPVVLVQPDPYVYRRVSIFEGPSPVSLIPDPRTGQWMFSRAAIMELVLVPAHGTNWLNEAVIQLPRNSTFVLVDQPGNNRLNRPNFFYFQTGPNPFATEYWSQTPIGGKMTAGAVVWLSSVNAYGGTGQFNLAMPGAQILLDPVGAVTRVIRAAGQTFGPGGVR